MHGELIEKNKVFFSTESINEAKRVLAANKKKSCPISLIELPISDIPVHIEVREYIMVQVFEERYPQFFSNAHDLSLYEYGSFDDEDGLLSMARFVGAQLAACNYLLRNEETKDKAYRILEELKDGTCPEANKFRHMRDTRNESESIDVLSF